MGVPTADGVIEWLNHPKYEERHNHLTGKRLPGTGQWFLESAEFHQWTNLDRQILLNLGRPGSGKSVLVSLVVATLQDMFHDNLSVGIAYYYCDYRDDVRNGSNPITSILAQLAKRSGHSMPDPLVRQYETYLETSEYPSFEQSYDALASFSDLFSKIYILVDGIDELSGLSRRLLFSHCMAFRGICNVNFLFTFSSSPYVPNEKLFSIATGKEEFEFETFPTLEIDQSKTEGDLGNYIDKRLSQMPIMRMFSDEVQEKTKSNLVEDFDGL